MAREVARGDIWLYRFAAPDKRRPVLVLSRPAALRLLRTTVVAPITTTIRMASFSMSQTSALRHPTGNR